MDSLISRIEVFMDANGLSEWQFGEAAMNDKHFVRQVRAGRDLRLSTLTRVDRFMSEYHLHPRTAATVKSPPASAADQAA